LINVFKKIGNRNVESRSNGSQPAGADAIAAYFVLLDLLKGEPQDLTNSSLAQSTLFAPKADTPANFDIDRSRHFITNFHVVTCCEMISPITASTNEWLKFH
jgi:hypothetical protein